MEKFSNFYCLHGSWMGGQLIEIANTWILKNVNCMAYKLIRRNGKVFQLFHMVIQQTVDSPLFLRKTARIERLPVQAAFLVSYV